MVEYVQTMIDRTKRRITTSYRIAVILVALVILMIAATTSYLMNSLGNDAGIINVAGRQRMLSQRIALLSDELIDVPESRRTEALQFFQAAITEMESNHQILVRDCYIDDGAPGHSKILQAIYFSPPLQLDSQVNDFLLHAHAVLRVPIHELSANDPDNVFLQTQARGRLLESLDAAVTIYKDEAIRSFNMLYDIVIGLSVLALLLLAGIALVVFKPAIAFVEQAQKRLLELNQLKGDFLANMSHEIRTPMNGIFGMTELLLDSDLTTRQQHYARTLQNSADHLLGLINDILDFSKLEAGQMKLEPIRFNLLATIEDVVELLASRARAKNLELLMRYVPGTPRFVNADPGRIRQVLFNLIGNAIKFTDQGYVMVHVEMMPPATAGAQAWLRVRIEDTGIGIPEDKIGGLFEKFMQVESGSTRAQQGTGLGLAISRNLVTLMGGTIFVESTPGKGTVFTWQIPLDGASDPQPSVDRQAMLAGKRILLVDDLAPNRLLYKEALTAAGTICLVAENAEEALSILAYEHESGSPVNAVVTDYMMPIVSGLRLTEAIRADMRFSSVPVIILTSAGEQGLIKRFDEAGANACLSKPATRQQLFETLAHVLDAHARGENQGIITAETNASLNARRLLTRARPLYGTHILLVEDNRVNLEITTQMLHQFGCEVSTACNGHEAIAAARAHAFDLIFMDCQMPEMDGFEAARHIVALKNSGQIAPVPIVALTANALKGDRERCLESGMDDYLSKPMRKASLEAILLKWLRNQLEARAKHEPPPAVVSPDAPPAPDEALSPTDFGVDNSVFDAAKEMLGNKLPTILAYYLEDAEGYINRIAESVERRDPTAAVAPAHTLKSSSRQLGVLQLATLAEKVEKAARVGNGALQLDEIQFLLPGMREALQHVRPFFQSSIAA